LFGKYHSIKTDNSRIWIDSSQFRVSRILALAIEMLSQLTKWVKYYEEAIATSACGNVPPALKQQLGLP